MRKEKMKRIVNEVSTNSMISVHEKGEKPVLPTLDLLFSLFSEQIFSVFSLAVKRKIAAGRRKAVKAPTVAK